MTNVKAGAVPGDHSPSQERFFLPEMTMSTAAPIETSPFSETTAIAIGLAALCIGTVTLIGGTGLMMWVFGL